MGAHRLRIAVTLALLLVISIHSIWQSSDMSFFLNNNFRDVYSSPSLGTSSSEDDYEFYNLPRSMGDFPRVFILNVSLPSEGDDRRNSTDEQDGSMILYGTPPDGTVIYRAFEKDWFQKCSPVEDIPLRPTCNAFHELNAFESPDVSLLSLAGNWRSVWKVEDRILNQQVVLKVLQIAREFNEDATLGHSMDIRVMERLTASPHVVSSFGFCGQSVFTELAKSSSSEVFKDSNLTWTTRLRIARDLARGLAELHALQPIQFDRLQKKNTSSISQLMELQPQRIFAHYDINTANTISLGTEQVQWNDFNLGIMTKQKSSQRNTTKKLCSIPIRYGDYRWRSPEEIQNKTGALPTMHTSDIYSFSNMLFAIMTKHQPWTNLEVGEKENRTVQVIDKKLRGELPNLPEKYQPRKPEASILWHAIKACYRLNPSERPSAFQLALALGTAYQWSTAQSFPEDIESVGELFKVTTKGTPSI